MEEKRVELDPYLTVDIGAAVELTLQPDAGTIKSAATVCSAATRKPPCKCQQCCHNSIHTEQFNTEVT